MTRTGRAPARVALGLGTMALGAVGLAGCTSTETGGGGAGETLRNMLLYGGTTVPPAARAASDVEAQDCPGVLVAEGRAAIRSGDGAAVRNQISIANVARECVERPDGTVVVKVGIEGRALLGPGGGSGRFDVPISFAVKRGDRVLSGRTRRVAVSVPPGQASASFVVVEGDLIVPPGTGEFDIEVGLGGSAAAAPRGRGRRG